MKGVEPVTDGAGERGALVSTGVIKEAAPLSRGPRGPKIIYQKRQNGNGGVDTRNMQGG